ncbi:MAG: hypothetical protein EXX96DRAFT_558644 [Benjaminiella poitrasii]|nr:MAG: hypothetical protein EXX96DRAFT_558644 [Benjaminiella poitrasii]
MYDNMTIQQQQQQQVDHNQDIYAILASDNGAVVGIDDSGPISTDALVMDLFDTANLNTLASPGTQQPLSFEEHPLSTCSNNNNNSIGSNNNSTAFPTPTSLFSSNTEFNFNRDLIGFDVLSNSSNSSHQQQQQSSSSSSTRMDSLLRFTEEDNPDSSFLHLPTKGNSNVDFTRRHSVAVSSGFNDFDLRQLSFQSYLSSFENDKAYLSSSLQSDAAQEEFKFPDQPFNSTKKTPLATVIEAEPTPNMMHRASMPNIFLTEAITHPMQKSVVNSTTTTPNSTPPSPSPPAAAITFNQMPWSGLSSTSSTNNNHSSGNDLHQSKEDARRFLSSSTTKPYLTCLNNQDDRPVIGRKRFYSQQFDTFPPTQSNNHYRHQPWPSYRQQQSNSSNSLCPLPMSDTVSRRSSVVTPLDISAWNRKVSPTHRIQPITTTIERFECETNKRPKNRAICIKEEEDETTDVYGKQETTANGVTIKRDPPIDNSHRCSPAVVEETTEDYPIITEADLEAAKKDPNAIPRRQKLRFDEDQYTPKWVRYTGQMKEGYCDTCKSGKWLQLKNSAFWYHKQFFHGISSVSGKPFENPLEQRAGEHDVIEGLCHQCKQFVPICNSKRKNSVLWYRHAHKCHIYDKPKSKGGKRATIAIPSTKKYQLHDQLQKIY